MKFFNVNSFVVFLFLSVMALPGFAQTKVYATGFDEDNIGLPVGSPWKQYAKSWLNGNATALTNGTYQAQGNSIFVDNLGRVYVAGSERGGLPIPGTITTNLIAKLWINGVALNLTDGTKSAVANSVYVYDGHTYVVGYESDGSTLTGKVWFDGTTLYNEPNAWLTGVYVVGTDIYYVGTRRLSPSSDSRAVIWKNGIELPANQQPATNGYSTTTASAIKIQVTGGIPTIYIAGSTTQSSTKTQATVWKNGVATYLTPVSKQPNGTIHSRASDLFVRNGVVYAVGYFYENYVQRAKLWVNGVASTLSAGENNAYATSVFVDAQGNVYVGGVEQNMNYANVPNMGMIWKNGAVHYSSLPGYRHSISSVFVK